jgi:hypothetical protein
VQQLPTAAMTLIQSGEPGPAQTGAFHLDGISCPTATRCVVTGTNSGEGVFGTVTIR